MTTNKDEAIILDTPEQINAYAFLMLRRAVIFRLETGHSLLRYSEARMARNYGWSTRTAFSKRLLDDLNKVGSEAGLIEVVE